MPASPRYQPSNASTPNTTHSTSMTRTMAPTSQHRPLEDGAAAPADCEPVLPEFG